MTRSRHAPIIEPPTAPAPDPEPEPCQCPPCLDLEAALSRHCEAVHAGTATPEDRVTLAILARRVDLAHGLVTR